MLTSILIASKLWQSLEGFALPIEKSLIVHQQDRSAGTEYPDGVVTIDGMHLFARGSGDTFERYGQDGTVFGGEQIQVQADKKGSTIVTFTTSQSPTAFVGNLFPGLLGRVWRPIQAFTDERVLIETRVIVPKRGQSLEGSYKLYGVSVINYRARGRSPNHDMTFPRTGDDVYRVYDSLVTKERLVVLVGRIRKGNTVLEAYANTPSGLKKLAKNGSGRFAGLVGRFVSGKVEELDVSSGKALIRGRIVEVLSHKESVLPPLSGQKRFKWANGRLYATVSPSGNTGVDDHRLLRLDGTKIWTDLGPYSLVGKSADGKTLAIQSSLTMDLWIVRPS